MFRWRCKQLDNSRGSPSAVLIFARTRESAGVLLQYYRQHTEIDSLLIVNENPAVQNKEPGQSNDRVRQRKCEP